MTHTRSVRSVSPAQLSRILRSVLLRPLLACAVLLLGLGSSHLIASASAPLSAAQPHAPLLAGDDTKTGGGPG